VKCPQFLPLSRVLLRSRAFPTFRRTIQVFHVGLLFSYLQNYWSLFIFPYCIIRSRIKINILFQFTSLQHSGHPNYLYSVSSVITTFFNLLMNRSSSEHLLTQRNLHLEFNKIYCVTFKIFNLHSFTDMKPPVCIGESPKYNSTLEFDSDTKSVSLLFTVMSALIL